MKPLLLLLLVAGCSGSAATAPPDGGGDPDAAVDPSVCAPDCTAGCAANQLCIASSRTNATCLQSCSSTADCPASTRCALVVLDPEDVGMVPPTLSQAVCVADPLFSTCGDTATPCALGAPSCLDNATLLKPMPIASTCGYELTPCAKGCVSAPADGGAVDHCA